MSLLELKSYGSKITSTSTMSSSVLLLYKAFGEKQLDARKLKPNKVATKAMPSTPKEEIVIDKNLDSLKVK